MRTSLVPNRASLFRDARLFTTTRATSRQHQIRNKTLETQTETVRVLLRGPRRGRKVSAGARLGPSERPCPAEWTSWGTRPKQLAPESFLGPRLEKPISFLYILSDCYKMARLLGPEWCLGQKPLAVVLYQLEQVWILNDETILRHDQCNFIW